MRLSAHQVAHFDLVVVFARKCLEHLQRGDQRASVTVATRMACTHVRTQASYSRTWVRKVMDDFTQNVVSHVTTQEAKTACSDVRLAVVVCRLLKAWRSVQQLLQRVQLALSGVTSWC